MRIAFGCDHGGYPLREPIIARLKSDGHTLIDCGAFSFDPVDDYPDYVFAAGEAIQRGEADRAIVVCGSAVGAAIAANKLRGIRASIAHDTYSAHQGVEHDNMNVLALGARVIGVEVALELVEAFIHANFSGAERHLRRIAKVQEMENKNGRE